MSNIGGAHIWFDPKSAENIKRAQVLVAKNIGGHVPLCLPSSYAPDTIDFLLCHCFQTCTETIHSAIIDLEGILFTLKITIFIVFFHYGYECFLERTVSG